MLGHTVGHSDSHSVQLHLVDLLEQPRDRELLAVDLFIMGVPLEDGDSKRDS